MALVPFTLASTAASAQATSTDSIAGNEVAFTSTQGTFAGVASGDLPGTWRAVIDHTVLSPDATITGGSFSLWTLVGGGPVSISGTFAPGGSVTRVAAGTHCRNQRYAIHDGLTNVGVGGGSGSGTVDATLTHYRIRIFGHCITYDATVSGTVVLAF
jgi:hypothetical protein